MIYISGNDIRNILEAWTYDLLNSEILVMYLKERSVTVAGGFVEIMGNYMNGLHYNDYSTPKEGVHYFNGCKLMVQNHGDQFSFYYDSMNGCMFMDEFFSDLENFCEEMGVEDHSILTNILEFSFYEFVRIIFYRFLNGQSYAHINFDMFYMEEKDMIVFTNILVE